MTITKNIEVLSQLAAQRYPSVGLNEGHTLRGVNAQHQNLRHEPSDTLGWKIDNGQHLAAKHKHL